MAIPNQIIRLKVPKRYGCMCYQMYSIQILNGGDVKYLNDFAIGTRVTGMSMASSGNQMAVISRDQKDKNILTFLEAQQLPATWYVSIKWMMNMPLKAVCLAEKGPYIVVASENSFLSFLVPNPFDGMVHTEWMKRFPISPLRSTALSSMGTIVLAGCEDGTVFAYRPDGEHLWKCTLGSSVEDLSTSANGELIVAGCRDGSIIILNSSGEILQEYQNTSSVLSLAISPEGTEQTVGYEDGHVSIFENDRKDPVLSFDRIEPPCGISYSKNGDMILLWSPTKCTLVHKRNVIWDGDLPGSPQHIRDAVLSPDGTFFVAGVSDNNSEWLKFYSIVTHQEMAARSEARGVIATGISLYTQGKYDAALSMFSHAESLVGPSLKSTFYRGETLSNLNDDKNAHDQFQKCLTYDDQQDRETLMMMGIAALHLKKEEKALDLFQHAESLEHNDASVHYAVAMTEYLLNSREGTCPPPLDDCMVAGLPIDLSSFLTSSSATKYERCFLIPCKTEALEQITHSGIYTTQVQRGIDAGYDIKKGDIGIAIDVVQDRLIGVFEASGFPQVRKPMPGRDPIDLVRSKKNILLIRVQKPDTFDIIKDASKILKSIKTEILMSRDGEPYIVSPVLKGDACSNVLYHFGLADKAVRYPEINDIILIAYGDLAGSKACVKGINRKEGTVTVELCDVTIAIPIEVKREMIVLDNE